LKHVEDSNKHIIEETVCQVGYLPELYEDARSEKYKKYFSDIYCIRKIVPITPIGYISYFGIYFGNQLQVLAVLSQ
jgi:hypothetical protein